MIGLIANALLHILTLKWLDYSEIFRMPNYARDLLYTTVESGKAVAIITGSTILNGADVIAMVEQTKLYKKDNNIVTIF